MDSIFLPHVFSPPVCLYNFHLKNHANYNVLYLPLKGTESWFFLFQQSLYLFHFVPSLYVILSAIVSRYPIYFTLCNYAIYSALCPVCMLSFLRLCFVILLIMLCTLTACYPFCDCVMLSYLFRFVPCLYVMLFVIMFRYPIYSALCPVCMLSFPRLCFIILFIPRCALSVCYPFCDCISLSYSFRFVPCLYVILSVIVFHYPIYSALCPVCILSFSRLYFIILFIPLCALSVCYAFRHCISLSYLFRFVPCLYVILSVIVFHYPIYSALCPVCMLSFPRLCFIILFIPHCALSVCYAFCDCISLSYLFRFVPCLYIILFAIVFHYPIYSALCPVCMLCFSRLYFIILFIPLCALSVCYPFRDCVSLSYLFRFVPCLYVILSAIVFHYPIYSALCPVCMLSFLRLCFVVCI